MRSELFFEEKEMGKFPTTKEDAFFIQMGEEKAKRTNKLGAGGK